MKKHILSLAVIIVAGSLCFAAEDSLLTAVKLLAQSQEDGCGLCAEDLLKKAVKIIDHDFMPGRKISADAADYFLITNECDKNEFVLSSYPGRGMLSPSEKPRPGYPLVTYRIHTEGDRLPGIHKNDYTDSASALPFLSGFLKHRGKGVGQIELISYKYGDGKCFVFFPKTNKIQFQCRIIDMKELIK